MPFGSGLSSQFGYKAESVYGTAVTVDRFIPHLGETVQRNKPRLVSDAVRSGLLVADPNDVGFGNQSVAGTIPTELYDRDLAKLFEHCLGSRVTTGSGPYTHTITPADNRGKSLTMQFGRPGSAGTVHPFTWLGVKIMGITITAQAGAIAKMDTEIIGREEKTDVALAAASYTAGIVPYRFSHGALTIGGSATKVRQIVQRFKNSYKADRFNFGSDLMDEPIMNGRTDIGGEMTAEFEDLTAYNRWVNGTTAALVLSFTNGANSLTITQNVFFDQAKVNSSGRELIEGSFPFVAVGATNAAACTIVIVDGNSAG